MNRLGAVLLMAAAALQAHGRVVNVAEHGVVPGADATLALGRLIESLDGEEGVTLLFPKGRYDFHAENAKEAYRPVANHDNGLKRMVFPLFGLKNIVIDGSGSLFMMHGRVVPITLEGVDGATLRNFTIDWIRSFHAELEVVERDAGSAVFEIDPQAYPYTIRNGELLFDRYGQEDPIGANIVFDPKTRAPIYNTDAFALNSWKPVKASHAGKNRVRIEGGFKEEPPPVGSVMIAYGVHPTSRLCPAIHVTNSKDLRIENVAVLDAGGMGLIVERTENIALEGMKVTSSAGRLVSTRADATHFIGCKGTIQVENCLFEHMLDDGINVHGAYVPVAEYLGNNQFLCDISHFQQWGLTFGAPGDRIALLSRLTVLPLFETSITGLKVLNEHRFIITVATLPEPLPDVPLSVENLSWHPELVMRNNTIRENRARSVLVTTKGPVLIENNYFSSQMHGILIEGDNNKWYESGAVGDVTIRSNRFVNIGYSCDNRYPLLASPLLNETQHLGEGRYHRNIRFIDNLIESFNGNLVEARSVEGLVVSGNTMVFSPSYPETEEGPAINLDYCDNVAIGNNLAKGFEHPLRIARTDSENLDIGMNRGFDASVQPLRAVAK